MNLVLRFLLAVIVTASVGAALSAQFVIAGLNAAGGEIDMAARLTMTARDVVSMGPIYAILIAIGFLIAFGVGGIAARLIPLPRVLIFAAAGAAALLAILLGAEQAFFGNQIISGARDIAGVAAQAIAGGLGGWLFARLAAKAG